MDTSWTPVLSDEDGPKYLSLARSLRDAVRDGILPEGSRLPPVRDLAWRLHVTPGTVARAYHIGVQEGLLQATVGRGTFVAARTPRLGPTQPLFQERDPPGTTGRLDLRSPLLPEVGQTRAFAAALHRMADQMGPQWLDYPSQTAEADLRAEVCRWLDNRDLGSFGPEDVMLTHGGQSAIALILACCLRGERPVVLTEELSYPGFRYAARAARAEVVTVEIDDEGILPAALEAACRRHGAQVLCLTPEAQNPTAARMGAARRAEVVAIARRHDLQVIEDECYVPAESNLPSLRAMAPERVWYAGSLSKSVSMALRFGYVVCPEGMGHAGRLTAQHGFFALSQAVSGLCLDLMRSGAAQDIRQGVHRVFADRLARLVAGLRGADLAWQPGIPFVWLRLPVGWRASTFLRCAEEEGVLLRSADQYAMVTGRAPNAVRLAIIGQGSDAEFDKAIAKLARLLRNPPSDMAV